MHESYVKLETFYVKFTKLYASKMKNIETKLSKIESKKQFIEESNQELVQKNQEAEEKNLELAEKNAELKAKHIQNKERILGLQIDLNHHFEMMLKVKKTQKGLMEEKNFILKRRMVSTNIGKELRNVQHQKKTPGSKKSTSTCREDPESLGEKKKKF